MHTLNTFEVNRHGQELKLMLSEMPFGDPFSGPPYGQYHKSKALGMVIGVVSAVATMGAALPMLASTVLTTQIAGGVMMAGGLMNGVGAVTGNKKLQKIGGILSLAGGIGGAVSGMTGGFGQGSTAIADMSKSMMGSINSVTDSVAGFNLYDMSKYGGSAATSAIEQAGSTSMDKFAQPGAMSGVPSDGLNSGSNFTGTGEGQLGTGVEAPTLKAVKAPGFMNNPELALETANNSGGSGTGTLSNGSGDTPNTTVSKNGGTPNTANNSGAAPSKTGNSFMDWFKNNPEMTKIIGEGVSGAAKLAFGGDSEEAQTAQAEAAAKHYGVIDEGLRTQNDVLKYQLENSQKQVAMLNPKDPNLDAKVADAKAKGHTIAFLPSYNAPVTAPPPVVPATVRPATYSTPTGA